jgi:hypothetical protein
MTDVTEPPKIPASLIDVIARGIGETFTFLQLDSILYRCAGDRVILGYTNDTLPLWTIARNCLDGAERDGLTVVFLAHVLAALPETAVLYVKIIEAVPQAKNALPEIKAQLPDILKGLIKTSEMLADPKVRAIVDGSKSTLQKTENGISLLGGYKGLHDCLHLLQIKQISLLLASTTLIATDANQSAALREYKDQVRTQAENAREVAKELPDEPTLRAVENKWIDELETAATFLQKALDIRNPAAAKIGIIRLSRVLEIQPPRLNDLIVAAANGLPLKEMSNALRNIASLGGDDAAAFAGADAALKNLDQALRARVAEHDQWQEIDKGIWVLEQVFSQSANEADDFTAYWPEMKSRVTALAYLSPGSAWSRTLGGYVDGIDLELLRLQSVAAAQDASAQKGSQLAVLFGQLSSEARYRFFVIDKQLKVDCSSLLSIGAPIQSILRKIGP